MSYVTRTDSEISALEDDAKAALLAAEPSFADRTYHQGVMDALQFLAGREENPYEVE